MKNSNNKQKSICTAVLIILIIVGFIVGIVLGLSRKNREVLKNENQEVNTSNKNETMAEQLINQQNRSPENVKVEILENTITRTSVEILITDNNKQKFGYDEAFKLQKKINGQWSKMDMISDNLTFNSLGYQIGENNQLKMKVNYGEYYGSLEDGVYRIVKSVYSSGNYNIFSNEFEIT